MIMKKIVLFETNRKGYSPSQCGETMTVGELIEALQELDEDSKVYFSNDNGYTYGNFYWDTISEDEEEEDNE